MRIVKYNFPQIFLLIKTNLKTMINMKSWLVTNIEPLIPMTLSSRETINMMFVLLISQEKDGGTEKADPKQNITKSQVHVITY